MRRISSLLISLTGFTILLGGLLLLMPFASEGEALKKKSHKQGKLVIGRAIPSWVDLGKESNVNVLNEIEAEVTNTTENPVPVVVQPELEPYSQSLTRTGSSVTKICAFDVPPGKRLIIEVLTFSARNGQGLVRSELSLKLVGQDITTHSAVGAFPTGNNLVTTAHGPFYADDTNAFNGRDISWAIQTLEFATVGCSITGRLIPEPNT